MIGIEWSGRDVTKLPIIGYVTTKEIIHPIDRTVLFESTKDPVVEIVSDGEIYVLNRWYKSGVPSIMHKDLVDKYEPIYTGL